MTKLSTQLSVTSWNVNGLIKRLNGNRYSKLDDPTFIESILFLILCLCVKPIYVIIKLFRLKGTNTSLIAEQLNQVE